MGILYDTFVTKTVKFGISQRKLRFIHTNFKKGLDKIHKRMYNILIMCEHAQKKKR